MKTGVQDHYKKGPYKSLRLSVETHEGATAMEQKQSRSRLSSTETTPPAHTFLACKKEGNSIQSLNTFLFTTSGIQSKITRYARKQDQMTEKPKNKKVKVDPQKFQIFELSGVDFKTTIFNMLQKLMQRWNFFTTELELNFKIKQKSGTLQQTEIQIQRNLTGDLSQQEKENTYLQCCLYTYRVHS